VALSADGLAVKEAARDAFEKGLQAFGQGHLLSALNLFEKSFLLDNTNYLCQSYIALLIASERGQLQRALAMCEEALDKAPGEAVIYLHMGRLYIRAERKVQAIETIRKGLGITHMSEGVALLDKLGTRKPPVFRFLPRDHFLNKYSGKLLRKIGLR
jgi:tetratricopeptide (TPR) repeat protein